MMMNDAFGRLLVSAKMLYANAEGCAINHYGEDFALHGLPGWLADCRTDIAAAEAALAHAREAGAQDPVAVPARDKMVADLISIANAGRRADGSDIPLGETLRKAAAMLAAAPASPPADSGEVERLISDAWDRLLNVDDRTSPEEYPEMALIQFDELAGFMREAALASTPAPQPFDPSTSPGMTDMMVDPDTLDTFMEANPLPDEPAPQPGGAAKVKALAERACTLLRGLEQWPEDRHPSFSKGDWREIKAVIAEAATLSPSPSGWDAGAEAMREACAAEVHSWGGLLALGKLLERIRALPLPTPPAGEG